MKNIYACQDCMTLEVVPEGPETALAGICEECTGVMSIIGWIEYGN